MSALKFAACGGAAPLYVDDVFSAWTYTGNGSTQTITNGIDLAGKGGMVWLKPRSGTYGTVAHALFDTARGFGRRLATNTTDAEFNGGNVLTAFGSSGFTVDASAYNASGEPAGAYVSWTFRNAPKFFHHQQVTKSSGSNATVDLSTLGTLGMVRVKRTDVAGSWYIWHRSLTAGKLLIGETTAAEATLGHITVSGTTVTLVNGVIADGTYLVEGFAHDTSATGIIQCGSFTGTQSAGFSYPFNDLGWEPQFLLVKRVTGGSEDWRIFDSSRALTANKATANSQLLLAANTSAAEVGAESVSITATGFSGQVYDLPTYIYLAIRRTNKPPTSGTQVYNAIARTGTGAAATVTGVGFAPDLVIPKTRSGGTRGSVFNKLTGALKALRTDSTAAEATDTDTLLAFGMDGISIGVDADTNAINFNTYTYINHFFKRAPGFFDEVCQVATGGSVVSVSHNLGTPPEFIIFKERGGTGGWYSYHSALGTSGFIVLNSSAASGTEADLWGATPPTASSFIFKESAVGLLANDAYVAYLFASLPGISKIFSYTGDGGTVDSAGTSQTINCGFSAGARFVMLKCTSHTSDWVIVDTVRGLVAGNDPALSLNTTAAEVTTTDLLDPDNSGFIVNQLATGTTSANFNVTGRTYIGLAIA